METLTAESAKYHCRTCLMDLEAKVQGDITATPKLWYHLQQTAELKNWLCSVMPAQSVEADHYPQFICYKCHEKLKKFHEFHDLVQSTSMVLDALYSENISQQQAIQIKEEQLEEEDYVQPELRQDNVFEYINIADRNEMQVDEECQTAQDNNAEYIIKFEPADNTEYITPSPTTLYHPPSDDEDDQPKAIKQYKCAECRRKFVHKYTYIAHIRQEHLGIDRAFECETCHKCFTKFCNLYRHMRLEHDEQLRQFKCIYENCKRSFRQLQTRRKHYEEYHKRPPKHASAEDPSLSMLQSERSKAAQRKKSTSPALAAEKQHKICAKNESRRFICPLCPAEHFETLYTLQLHMQTHTDEMNYVCTICGKHKISQAKLDEHIATAHDTTNYPCPVCGKIFKNKSHVSVHICSVHKGLRPYACSYCSASFAARNTLKLHVRTHTGEKPFVCDICGRRFTQLSPMKKHKKTHEKGRRNAISEEQEAVV